MKVTNCWDFFFFEYISGGNSNPYRWEGKYSFFFPWYFINNSYKIDNWVLERRQNFYVSSWIIHLQWVIFAANKGLYRTETRRSQKLKRSTCSYKRREGSNESIYFLVGVVYKYQGNDYSNNSPIFKIWCERWSIWILGCGLGSI